MRVASSRTVLVADSSKFGRSAAAVVCATDEVDVVVTDGSVGAETAAALRDSGVELLSV